MPVPPPPPPSSSSSFAKQRAKKTPRHGSSLPLLAFAGAKKTTYDPRVAKQKASNLAAKRVNDFRKLKARLEAQGRLAVPSSIARVTISAAAAYAAAAEEGGEEENRRRRPPPPPPPPPVASSVAPSRQQSHKPLSSKPLNTLQRIAARNEQARGQAAQARAEAAGAAAAARERAAAAGARRREQTALLRKKTRRGQPVMKYRMEGILSKLAAESAMGGGGGGGRG